MEFHAVHRTQLVPEERMPPRMPAWEPSPAAAAPAAVGGSVLEPRQLTAAAAADALVAELPAPQRSLSAAAAAAHAEILAAGHAAGTAGAASVQ